MREIKFRAWNQHKKEMFLQDDQYLTSFLRRLIRDVNYENDILSEHESYLPHHLDSYLMQYTGLKDKNGVEIYEGDYVRVRSTMPFGEEYDCDGVVDFLECGFVVTDRKTFAEPLFVEGCEIEVIGNVYENPELLEV